MRDLVTPKRKATVFPKIIGISIKQSNSSEIRFYNVWLFFNALVIYAQIKNIC